MNFIKWILLIFSVFTLISCGDDGDTGDTYIQVTWSTQPTTVLFGAVSSNSIPIPKYGSSETDASYDTTPIAIRYYGDGYQSAIQNEYYKIDQGTYYFGRLDSTTDTNTNWTTSGNSQLYLVNFEVEENDAKSDLVYELDFYNLKVTKTNTIITNEE